MRMNEEYNLFPLVTDITRISGLVIFTQKVCLDNRLSGTINRWFQAGNFEDGMAFLRQRTSREIIISTACMDRIVERLNAKPFVMPPPRAPIDNPSQPKSTQDERPKDKKAGTSAKDSRWPTQFRVFDPP